METSRKLSGFLVLACLLVAALGKNTDIEDDDDDEFLPYDGQRFDGFDWRLCREVNTQEKGNVVVSPVGVKLLLALLFEVSHGKTALEIQRALQLPAKRLLMREEFQSIVLSLEEQRKGYLLSTGTKVFIDKSLKPIRKSQEIFKDFYKAYIETIDFEKTSNAVETINSWVSNITKGHVPKMITTEDKLIDMKVLFLNALYFKGMWRYPFPLNSTTRGVFHMTPNRTVVANYMTLTANLYYSESKELNAKILRLPYEGKKYSMFVVLPNTVEGFQRMLQVVNPLLIREQLSLMIKQEVHVILPKFKYDYTIYLKEILQKVGIREAFSISANIQGLATSEVGRSPNIEVSDVLQKVGLDVNEEGTTAHSVTEMDFVNKFGGDTSTTFNATHPFMIFIEEEKTGSVIFVGKVVDPTNTMPFKFREGIQSRMGEMGEIDEPEFVNPYQPDNDHKLILPKSIWQYITSGKWLRGKYWSNDDE